MFLLKNWRQSMLHLIIMIVVLYFIAYVIHLNTGGSLQDVSFYIGVIALVIGLLGLMEGRSFGNRIAFPGNEGDSTSVMLEMEVELQEIKRQGPDYVTNNRRLILRQWPALCVLAALIMLLLNYALL